MPLIPRVMRRVDPRLMVAAGCVLFIFGSLLAVNFSDNFAGPQFIASSLVQAVGPAIVMTPLSSIAVAGIEPEHAPSASALFDMIRNLGGAIGIAVLQTCLTKREQFHSVILNAQASLLNGPTRDRPAGLTHRFMARGVSDPAVAQPPSMGVGFLCLHAL